MNNILNKTSVLVLNRNWQAINIRTPTEAFCQMATDVATALDIDGESMWPVRWGKWLKLPVRASDNAVLTTRGSVRIPTVIVLANYSKVPKTRPKLSAKTIRQRDKYRCQYTGRILKIEEGSVDHVLPRSRGGKTSWENCVWASKLINARKANRLPEEVGLQLLAAPQAPKEIPITFAIQNIYGIKDWEYFLLKGG